MIEPRGGGDGYFLCGTKIAGSETYDQKLKGANTNVYIINFGEL